MTVSFFIRRISFCLAIERIRHLFQLFKTQLPAKSRVRIPETWVIFCVVVLPKTPHKTFPDFRLQITQCQVLLVGWGILRPWQTEACTNVDS
jgi:hypothetical protein